RATPEKTINTPKPIEAPSVKETVYKAIEKDTHIDNIREPLHIKETPVAPIIEKQEETKLEELRATPEKTINTPKPIEAPSAKETVYKAIEKDTLRKIIRDVIKPKEQSPTKKAATIPDIKHKITETTPEVKHYIHHHEHTIKDLPGKATAKERGIREITPEEFHSLKEIHPHEKISIKKSGQEIKPGEVIKF
ncbi:MAG: hypothetical protein WCP03_04655, partial [Candidatus Saccharibacteria bacterium]